MSNEDDGLPTATIFVENTKEPYYSDIYFGEKGFNRDNMHDLDYFRDSNTHNVVETVRRKDVEDLIQDKIQQKLQYYEEGNTPFDSYESSALRPFARELKEQLLEEIQQKNAEGGGV